ncbi:Rap1a/Tai family immunity protein [Saccharospirillum salsuginis]|uniref:Rap1a immunity protein domain-containing protein n=1 Tax=Saccharospirillum salsuginis TaxID=418750 RepID=A0A918N9P4_9GAMM|nr:Rap1a/Tai family immunity protein [Saccharospirillum salsuginis]GGX51420.1 hypothetical protein GCM10007392_18380 [Saccharospirillum salsuginis]
MIRASLALTALLSLSTASTAETGLNLYQSCKLAQKAISGQHDGLSNEQFMKAIQCASMVEGMRYMADLYRTIDQGLILACIPDGKSTGDIVDSIVSYIESDPELLDMDESMVATSALTRSYKCN